MIRFCGLAFVLVFSLETLPRIYAQQEADVKSDSASAIAKLSDEQWKLLEPTVDNAIVFLISNQLANGSFAVPNPAGQPGITSLCSLAILSSGATPGSGDHGKALVRAIDYVLDTQQENGLFSFRVPERNYRPNGAAHAALYNHAMAGLLLTEVYGMTSPEQSNRILKAIPKAIALTRKTQVSGKRREIDQGGWKYFRRSPHTTADSDLSVTAWQLMFLRSAKNAGFEVPEEYARDAIKYIKRCFDGSQKEFLYGIREPNRYTSRGVVGAGIFALSLGGEHSSKQAKLAADKLLMNNFDYNSRLTPYEQYHYTIYHCSQAMFQLGEPYWSEFYPPLLKTLASKQLPDGSWNPSPGWAGYGKPYTVALTVLALTPPYQILPIYQR